MGQQAQGQILIVDSRMDKSSFKAGDASSNDL